MWREDQFSREFNLTGLVLGIGWEQPISPKTSVVATSAYSFTEYKDKTYLSLFEFDDVTIDFGGPEFGLEIRYYLK